MEPISNSEPLITGNFSLLSPTLRRVLDALLEGKPVASGDRAALSESEWNELRALARTAHLTTLTLHRPVPSPETEAAALERAQKVLAEVGPRVSANPPPQEMGESKPSWLDRLKSFLGIESVE